AVHLRCCPCPRTAHSVVANFPCFRNVLEQLRSQKNYRKTSDAGLLVSNNAKPEGARFTSKKSRSSSCCAAAGRHPADSCHHHGRRRGHTLVSAHQRSR